MSAVARVWLTGVLAVSVSASALGQESKSAALAKQLSTALDMAKLGAVAAKDPSKPGVFVAALYFPGAQLLVVSAQYSVPMLLDEKITKKDYREVYLDLSSASLPESRVFIEDPGANGLKAKRDENQPFDTYEAAGKRTMFDNDWKGQKLSEDDYMKIFSTADERYSQMLAALIEQLKKTS